MLIFIALLSWSVRISFVLTYYGKPRIEQCNTTITKSTTHANISVGVNIKQYMDASCLIWR